MPSTLFATLLWSKRLVEAVVLLFFFTVTGVIILLPMPMVLLDSAKAAVGDDVPDDFPYLVLTPAAEGGHTPAIVLHHELEQFKQTHPEHTFFVPKAESQRLNGLVREMSREMPERDSGPERFWQPWFLVQKRRPDHLRIKVYAAADNDHENIGWYRVTEAGVTPLFHQAYRKTNLAWQAFIIGGSVNLGIWAILVTAYRARKKRRQQAADCT